MSEKGLKARVAKTLELSGGRSMTMGEIMEAAGIEKTSASDVSSALYKLRNEGRVKAVRGESTSKNGPRFVRRYSWGLKVPAVRQVDVREAAAASPLQMLGIGRIG